MAVVWQRADVDEWLAVMTNWLMVGRCPWCVEAKVKMIHSRYSSRLLTCECEILNSLNKEEELWKEVEVAGFVVTSLFYRWNRFTGTSFLLSAGWLYRDGLQEFNCCCEYSQGAWLCDMRKICGTEGGVFCILMLLKAKCVCVRDGALWPCRGFLNKRAGGRFNMCGIFSILVVVVRNFQCLTA